MQKPILRLKGRLDRGTVLLSWLKSSPFFQSQNETEFSPTRVWRQEVGFVFNEDYEEFFLNLAFKGAELLFEGQLPAAQKRRYQYRDETAVVGKTYAYWIQTRTSQPIGPIPVRVRDMEIWWPYKKIQQEIQSLAELNPGLVQVFSCGYTAQGREIPAVQIGSSPQRLALVGLIHAGESGPELIVPALRRLLQQDPHLFDEVSILAVPGVNLDAREELVTGTPWYLRTNHQGVDLNRNFPAHWEQIEYGYGLDSSDPDSVTYRGPRAGSAPETQALLELFNSRPVKLLLSYHALASICGLPALVSKFGASDDDYTTQCRRIIKIFARAFGLSPELVQQQPRFACSAGSLSTWFYEHGKIPAFDLEEGCNKTALQLCRRDETTQEILQQYREQHYQAIKALLEAKW